MVERNRLYAVVSSFPGGKIAYGQYITPAIAVFALTAATYSFVIFSVATARASRGL